MTETWQNAHEENIHTPENDTLLTLREAAELLHCSYSYTHRLVVKGRLPALRLPIRPGAKRRAYRVWQSTVHAFRV